MGVSLIIAAGGSGERFQRKNRKRKPGPGTNVPGLQNVSKTGRFADSCPNKLFETVGDKPVLRHALDSFRRIPAIREILLAVPGRLRRRIKNQILKNYSGPRVRLVTGGATRAESVRNALRRTSSRNDWVMVHDGARPFPPRKGILDLIQKRSGSDGVILARPVVPTLKRVGREENEVLETVDRTGLFEAETPQLVRRSFLVKAYQNHPAPLQATDESSLIESAGGKVRVVTHDGWNPKITTPQDLEFAEAVCGGGTLAVGFGRDTHRLVEGRKFFLGGVRVPFHKGALGHSDGDALLHAVSDAILGAAGAGDIGEWFSDQNPKNRNLASEKILKKVCEVAAEKGWAPNRIDSVVTLEKPRLGRTKELIRKRIARMLHLKEEAVSVKAKTSEGLGPEGEGKAVTCEALVTLKKAKP